ncbi:MAG: hypothetical protein U5P10_13045 [Spirochaetia bacterium]|nr:hypothetical protein [Spirochaetia bacterium]
MIKYRVKSMRDTMKLSATTTILKTAGLLVFLGLFLPITYDLGGYQVAQGILGNTQQLGKATLLGPIADLYGYALLGVFLCALLSIVATYVSKRDFGYFVGCALLAVSLLLSIVVALKFLSLSNSKFLHFITTTFGIQVTIQAGGYSMGAGYLAAVVGFVLRVAKIIK